MILQSNKKASAQVKRSTSFREQFGEDIEENTISLSKIDQMHKSSKIGILKLPAITPIYERNGFGDREKRLKDMKDRCARLAKGLPCVNIEEPIGGFDDPQEDLFSLLQLPAHYLNGFDFNSDDGHSAKELQRIVGELKDTKKSRNLLK